MKYILILIILLTSCTKVPPMNYYSLNIKLLVKKHYIKDKTITISYPISTKEPLGKSLYYSYSNIELDRYNSSIWSSSLYKLLHYNISKASNMVFKNVVDYSSLARSDYRLESSVEEFYHKVRPNLSLSIVTIKFTLIDSDSKRIIKSKRFSYQIPTTTKDARGYVEATNKALSRLLNDLIIWL